MKEELQKRLIKQLDDVIRKYEHLRSKAEYDDLSGGTTVVELIELRTLAKTAIERVGGQGSEYYNSAVSVAGSEAAYGRQINRLVGIILALKSDIEAGYLSTIEELLHGELFVDFLEMASYLLDEGYKDASAVIAGSTLEAHLRQICNKRGIDTEPGGKPKKADRINSELAKASAYSKLVQKNITAWLDLRNKAAHGKYDEYVKEEVSLMIAGVRDFLTRYPA